MAYLPVTQVVAKVVLDAKNAVVKDIIKHLETKMEINEDMKNWFDEFSKKLNEEEIKEMRKIIKNTKKLLKKKETSGEKKIKSPSIYNLYIKDRMSLFKEEHKEIKDGRELMKLLGGEWKNDPMVIFIKNNIDKLLLDNNNLSINDVYYQLKSNWNKENNTEENIKDTEENMKGTEEIMKNTEENMKDIEKNMKNKELFVTEDIKIDIKEKNKKKSKKNNIKKNKIVEESDNE